MGHFHALCIILPICTDQGGSRCSWCHPHAAASGKCSLSAAFSRVGFIWDNFLFKTPLIKLAGDQCSAVTTNIAYKKLRKNVLMFGTQIFYILSCVYFDTFIHLIYFILSSTGVGLKNNVILFASCCHGSSWWFLFVNLSIVLPHSFYGQPLAPKKSIFQRWGPKVFLVL